MSNPPDACARREFCDFLDREIAAVPDGRGWWSQTGSNRRPHACKARALPTELWPRTFASLTARLRPSVFARQPSAGRAEAPPERRLVGPGRLELPTSRLSGVRSNQLSYGPAAAGRIGGTGARPTFFEARQARDLIAWRHIAPPTAMTGRKEKRRRRRPAPVYFANGPIETEVSGGPSLERR